LAFLEAINAPDLGLFINGQDFAATQDMTEESRQDVTYQGAFGVEGPLLRQVRHADDGTITFTAILLKRGVSNGLNSEKQLLKMRDFQIVTRRGEDDEGHTVYNNCNWTRVTVRSGIDQVTLDCDVSVPGFVR
jgi:hypothetical protein